MTLIKSLPHKIVRRKVKMGLFRCSYCNKEIECEIRAKRPGSSCGCYGSKRTHGLSRHPLYGIFNAMHQRCENPNDSGYENYGGRGISVCEEWSDFKTFYNWAISKNWKHGDQIDRIENDSGYSPTNCRITDCYNNVMNRRNTVHSIEEIKAAINDIKSGRTSAYVRAKYNMAIETFYRLKNMKSHKQLW